MKKLILSILCISTLILSSCNKESVEAQDPIVGEWFLTQVNEIAVAEFDCYKDSFIKSDGSCTIVLDNTEDLTIESDFYYLGDEAIEIYVDGNQLRWRVDTQTTLIFEK
jgi:hypothetical protein